MASLVDVNVLIALLHGKHVHSGQAVRWLDAQGEVGSVLICRVAQMGALRLLTNQKLMKEHLLSAEIFWKGWELLMKDERFSLIKEPAHFEQTWRAVTCSLPKGKCAETDAYLAAVAQAGGWCLVTFDRGFQRFPNLQMEILS